MSEQEYEFKHGTIYGYVREYIESLPDLTGKVVVDIPCGDGRTSLAFRNRGATVKAFDLFPEFMMIEGITAEFADLSERLPLDDASVDILVCQEGIEHIPDKVGMFREFNRVLKPGGQLIITAPSISHVRGRLSRFLFESDHWRRMPPTELDSVWFSEDASSRLYFGHLFLIGVQHLTTICRIAGFEVAERRKTKISGTSVLLGVLLYPLLVLVSFVSMYSYSRKIDHIDAAKRSAIFRERVRLNLSPTTLFRRFVFWVLTKDKELDAAAEELKALTRGH